MGLIKTEKRAAKDLRYGDRIVRADADFQIATNPVQLHERVHFWAYSVPTQWRRRGPESLFSFPPNHEVEVLPAG